ncbi:MULTISPECIES: peptidoglycan editing factor PgeF [unclassified Pseudomonas]|uniref:D-alanyl-alanine synthetase n=1 Tax=Pseudomonas gorinensis TaxID=3240790 RepID=A0ACA7P040_9PSED|nr:MULTISPECIES: peptidoglycan editing factor PgeF [unclassified Pseudomonas]AHC33335.1 D-alanyl-alanine synthetase [Pseudomonas sp. TKP]MBL1308894.1 peptidoglycan editing factor PgeF [Pseudomonas sp.]PMX15484.1 peptidoglycan editing factor PgeF [Pseudomonas sp. MPBC4-3]PMX48475.1 peptidoglycan editing factor PgeF [Pseudomonas sp. FW301-21B01]PMY08162.1 peptidoglycan editing factor PgeF [Pseudomonas sp. MPR-R5A]
MQQANNLGALAGVDHGFCLIDDPSRPDEVFICKQVHSAAVIEWQAGQVANTIEADGVHTGQHQPIAVITADCLPILFAAKNGERVAAVHGGWKGLQRGIVATTVQHFADAGIGVDQLLVAIGPSIKPCCYEVSEGFIAEFQADQGHLWQHDRAPWSIEQPRPLLAPHITPPQARHTDSAWFDLSRYGLMLLQAAGVRREQIEVSEVCTYCTSPLFASYRRRTHHPQETKTLIYSWIARKP